MHATRGRAVTLVAASLLAAVGGCDAEPDLGADNAPVDYGRYGTDPSALVARGNYAVSTTERCGGLPTVLGLRTPAGVCVGLVGKGYKFPRGIVERANGDLVLVDMGGWAANSGSVRYLRRAADGTFAEELVLQDGVSGSLLRRIDRPSGAAIGPDGFVYVGTPRDIFRFDPSERPRPVLEQVARFAQDPPGARHPLTHFVFTPDSFQRPQGPWTVYVNVGSATDVCEAANGTFPAVCAETEANENPRAVVRRLTLGGPRPAGPRPTGGWPLRVTSEVFARGLRNSMALAVHPQSGLVIQAENSRDAIHTRDPSLRERESDLPHEEINVLRQGGHYGWPYCFDQNVPNPEYPTARCGESYLAPSMLLPGHSSPLAMRYYQGDMMPASWRGGLVMTLHGGRAYGHRLVLLPTRENGVPTGELFDLVAGWDDRPAAPAHPRGRPVDVIVAHDGSLFVTEDHNGTVFRVFYDPRRGDGAPLRPETVLVQARPGRDSPPCVALASRTTLFAQIQREVIDPGCVEGCHSAQDGAQGGMELNLCDDVGNSRRLRAETGPGGRPWIVAGNPNASRLMDSLMGRNGAPRMPAQGLTQPQIDLVARWIREGAQP